MKIADINVPFSVFCKVIHTDEYLQFSSNQPLQHKTDVITTLYHRTNTTCYIRGLRRRYVVNACVFVTARVVVGNGHEAGVVDRS